jgi:hypothetical protein
MINSLIVGITSLVATETTQIKENIEASNQDVCRITCTMNVPDGFGGTIGFSATSGNIFTSCETAREDACDKLLRKITEVIIDM